MHWFYICFSGISLKQIGFDQQLGLGLTGTESLKICIKGSGAGSRKKAGPEAWVPGAFGYPRAAEGLWRNSVYSLIFVNTEIFPSVVRCSPISKWAMPQSLENRCQGHPHRICKGGDQRNGFSKGSSSLTSWQYKKQCIHLERTKLGGRRDFKRVGAPRVLLIMGKEEVVPPPLPTPTFHEGRDSSREFRIFQYFPPRDCRMDTWLVPQVWKVRN